MVYDGSSKLYNFYVRNMPSFVDRIVMYRFEEILADRQAIRDLL